MSLICESLHAGLLALKATRSWHTILTGPQPLIHALVISISRTQQVGEAPSPHSLLSSSSELIELVPLSVEGVRALIVGTVQAPFDRLSVLTRLLFAETSGLPLFVLSLLQTMVR